MEKTRFDAFTGVIVYFIGRWKLILVVFKLQFRLQCIIMLRVLQWYF